MARGIVKSAEFMPNADEARVAVFKTDNPLEWDIDQWFKGAWDQFAYAVHKLRSSRDIAPPLAIPDVTQRVVYGHDKYGDNIGEHYVACEEMFPSAKYSDLSYRGVGYALLGANRTPNMDQLEVTELAVQNRLPAGVPAELVIGGLCKAIINDWRAIFPEGDGKFIAHSDYPTAGGLRIMEDFSFTWDRKEGIFSADISELDGHLNKLLDPDEVIHRG